MSKLHLAYLVAASFLLAGCASTSDTVTGPVDSDGASTPGPGQGFAPQTGFDEDIQGDLHLSVFLSTCEAGFCLRGLAENEGADTYHVSNICVSPFSDAMKRQGEPVYPREPQAVCEAFGTAPFAPGASMEANFTWDQKLWDQESESMQDAPEGPYQWSMIFDAYEHANGGDRVTLTATVTVIVGET